MRRKWKFWKYKYWEYGTINILIQVSPTKVGITKDGSYGRDESQMGANVIGMWGTQRSSLRQVDPKEREGRAAGISWDFKDGSAGMRFWKWEDGNKTGIDRGWEDGREAGSAARWTPGWCLVRPLRWAFFLFDSITASYFLLPVILNSSPSVLLLCHKKATSVPLADFPAIFLSYLHICLISILKYKYKDQKMINQGQLSRAINYPNTCHSNWDRFRYQVFLAVPFNTFCRESNDFVDVTLVC